MKYIKGGYMKSLKSYQDMANRITDKLYERTKKARENLATKIRNDVLLPFCRKHKLEMSISVYSNTFTLPNGEVIDDCEIADKIDDPMSNEISKYLDINFMGDYLFDGFMENIDIDKDDLEWHI